MDVIASEGWMVFRVILGVGIVGLLLVCTKAGQAVLCRMHSWLTTPSRSQCKRLSDEMLADMDANIAAKKAARVEVK